MNIVLTNQPAAVTIAAPDGATDYSYRVIDQNEAVLVPDTALASLGGLSEVVITVPDTINALAAGTIRALRSVVVHFTTPGGLVKTTSEYIVEEEQTLVVNVNTFQTYGESVLNAYELFNLAGWSAASQQDRASALIAARRNISQLRFRYVFDAYQNIVENTVGVSDLSLITPSNWATLPADFKAALKRAQILEADFLLTGGENLVDVKRRMGIVSETIGESSMFMRSVKPLDLAICRRALKELSKYVLHRVRTTRS